MRLFWKDAAIERSRKPGPGAHERKYVDHSFAVRVVEDEIDMDLQLFDGTTLDEDRSEELVEIPRTPGSCNPLAVELDTLRGSESSKLEMSFQFNSLGRYSLRICRQSPPRHQSR